MGVSDMMGLGRTLAEVLEVHKLVVPLCDDPDGVFDECNDDEEAADGREVSVDAVLDL